MKTLKESGSHRSSRPVCASVPCGMADGLAIGMMITGRHFDDLTLLQVADTVEKSGDWKGF